jgi:anti-sigma28 factor (negative regulator of flagellin synthesis)
MSKIRSIAGRDKTLPAEDPLATTGESREDRVARLREEIRAGRYQPNPRDIARRLLDHWRHRP